MPVVERETTVTRSIQGADQLKQNLSVIASEIQKVRDQAQNEVGTLERIRKMLDAGYLTDLLQTVTGLQERIRSLEGESLGSGSELSRMRTQLQQEQARLEKLWDAYKTQEDELARLKRDHPLLEEKLHERDRTIEGMRRDISRLEPLSRFKGMAEQFEHDNGALRTEVEHLQGELKRTQEGARDAAREMEALRATGVSQERVRELEHNLEDERERLAKLYKVYEDLEAQNKAFEKRLKVWQDWFRQVQPAMEQLCGAAGGPSGA